MVRLLPTFLLLCSTAGVATTVYKTVDEGGVVSFSDTPADASAEVLTINAPAPRSPEEATATLEAMRETTDRMAADRREREKHRAELREIADQGKVSQVPHQQIYNEYYYPVNTRNGRYHGRPPYYPGNKPVPRPPIVHPPLLPNNGPFRPSNSQLMRPMLPSRR